MKLFIPSVGDELVLAADWTFTLYNEERNKRFGHHIGAWEPADTGHRALSASKETLPKGTRLRVERVYIRQGGGEYNSLTFRVVGWKGTVNRFWVKIRDANNMEIE